tara:strand:+ start:3392 stop:4528 length:1137 start_codon:yes stop_codon:yes gene_type:complete
MSFESFQEELRKIARARSLGRIDLSSIHQQNLQSQRKDLTDAERSDAYIRAGIGGMAGGAALPTIMYALPAAVNPQDIDTGIRSRHLSNALEIALTKNPKLMGGKKGKKEIKATADALAQHYYSIPKSLRESQLEGSLRAIRTEYRDPQTGPKWTAPKTLGKEISEALGNVPKGPDGRFILSRVDVDRLLDSRNHPIVAGEVSKVLSLYRGALDPGKKVINKNPKIIELPDIPKPKGTSPDDYAHLGMRLQADQIRDMAQRSENSGEIRIQRIQAQVGRRIKDRVSKESDLNLQPFKFQPTLSSHVPNTTGILKIVSQIEKRHGKKAKMPSNLAVRADRAVKALRGARTSIALSAGLGTLAGLASIRRKRQTARELRR